MPRRKTKIQGERNIQSPQATGRTVPAKNKKNLVGGWKSKMGLAKNAEWPHKGSNHDNCSRKKHVRMEEGRWVIPPSRAGGGRQCARRPSRGGVDLSSRRCRTCLFPRKHGPSAGKNCSQGKSAALKGGTKEEGFGHSREIRHWGLGGGTSHLEGLAATGVRQRQVAVRTRKEKGNVKSVVPAAPVGGDGLKHTH